MNDKNCKTCFYCKSQQVVDIVLQSFLNNLTDTSFADKVGLSSVSTYYKCHFSGKPQIVDADKDWCYQWKKE